MSAPVLSAGLACPSHTPRRPLQGLQQRRAHAAWLPGAQPQRQHYTQLQRHMPHLPCSQLQPAAGPFGGLFGGLDDCSSSSEVEQPVTEDEEGSKMLLLDASSSGSLDGSGEAPFGPLVVLAIGFNQLEFELLRRLLHKEMEAEMVKVVPAPAAAMAGSLGAALEVDPVPPFEQVPLGTRRVLFLSGMYASEVMEVVTAYRETGLPESVFAAAVPNNYDRPLAELVQEVFADHQAMRQQRAAAAAATAQEQ